MLGYFGRGEICLEAVKTSFDGRTLEFAEFLVK